MLGADAKCISIGAMSGGAEYRKVQGQYCTGAGTHGKGHVDRGTRRTEKSEHQSQMRPPLATPLNGGARAEGKVERQPWAGFAAPAVDGSLHTTTGCRLQLYSCIRLLCAGAARSRRVVRNLKRALRESETLFSLFYETRDRRR